MNGLAIREAVAADRDALRTLCMKLDPLDYVPDAWDEWRARPGHRMLVALAGGRMVGCVHSSVVAPRQAFMQALRVDPDARRHGVATRLMEEVTSRLRADGIVAARGVTAFANDRARRFFRSIGHREAGVVRRRRLPDWTPGAHSTIAAGPLPAELPVSVEGRAHFRRVVFSATMDWLAAAARDGRWHAKDGAWVLLDPPSAAFGAWVVALGGPPAGLRDLLRTLSPPWDARGGLAVESPDDASIAGVLDELGFDAAGPDDTYVVVATVP